MLSKRIKRVSEWQSKAILTVNFILIGIILASHLANYLNFELSNILGLSFLAFSLFVNSQAKVNRHNYVLIGLLIFFTGLHFINYSKSFLCISLVCYILVLINRFYSKVSFYHIATALLVLPFYQFCENSISIPLRIELSNLAGSILKAIDPHAFASGNIIHFNNNDYIIDTGCAGLKMLKITLLFCGVYIFVFQDKTQKTLNTLSQMGLYGMFILLNLICNLIRILTLVMCNINETETAHYVVGGLCLLIYVLLPAYFIITKIFKSINSNGNTTNTDLIVAPSHKLLNYAYCIVLISFSISKPTAVFSNNYASEPMGYHSELIKNGVKRFSKKDVVIYLKPIISIFSLEHNPTVCWSSEGYKLKKINKETFDRQSIYTGEFEKGNQKIYAAWWFSNGKTNTINQLSWRMEKIFKRKDFTFININASSKTELEKGIHELLKTKGPT